MTKEEKLKVYSAYLPYGLELQHKYKKAKHTGETVLRSWVKSLEHLDLGCLFPHRKDSFDWKPILYDLSYLTQEELRKAGFSDHIDYLTHEREGWIDKYGFEDYLNKLPYGHFQYLVSKHYNVFNLSEDQFINKATLKTK